LGVFENRWEAADSAAEFCGRCVRAVNGHPKFQHYDVSNALAAFESHTRARQYGQLVVNAQAP